MFTSKKTPPKKPQIIDLTDSNIDGYFEDLRSKQVDTNPREKECLIQIATITRGSDLRTYLRDNRDIIVQSIQFIHRICGGSTEAKRRDFMWSNYANVKIRMGTERRSITFKDLFTPRRDSIPDNDHIGHRLFPMSYDVFQYLEVFAMSRSAQQWVSEPELKNYTKFLLKFKRFHQKSDDQPWTQVDTWDTGDIPYTRYLHSEPVDTEDTPLETGVAQAVTVETGSPQATPIESGGAIPVAYPVVQSLIDTMARERPRESDSPQGQRRSKRARTGDDCDPLFCDNCHEDLWIFLKKKGIKWCQDCYRGYHEQNGDDKDPDDDDDI